MTKKNLISVLCVDDHPLMREGIAAVIRNESDMSLAAEASSGREAIDVFDQCIPDITLMDIRLPDMSGIEAMVEIRKRHLDARVLMLTTFEGDSDIRRSLELGARAYLLKSLPRSELTSAIRRVHSGVNYVPVDVAANLAQYLGTAVLSQREVQILERIAGGNRNMDIGRQLHISEETVKGHVKHIMEKLGARDRTEAVAIGVRRGIIRI